MMAMTATQLLELVREMRHAQRAYFRLHTEEWLKESRRLERAVDRAFDEILRQPGFFDAKE